MAAFHRSRRPRARTGVMLLLLSLFVALEVSSWISSDSVVSLKAHGAEASSLLTPEPSRDLREDATVLHEDGFVSTFPAAVATSAHGAEPLPPEREITEEVTGEMLVGSSLLQVSAAGQPTELAAAAAEGVNSQGGNTLAKTLAAAAASQKQTTTKDRHALLTSSLSSVVKIFVDITMPDYFSPWQMQAPKDASGSGFVVEGKRILTNGHVVGETTRVLVRKHGNAKKFLARVVATAHEADLALLEVESDEFWENLQPLPFGGIPRLRDSVTVLGYPTGGDQLSITEGIVSRVGMSMYAHSSVSLLTVQIDAAINPGNSGGPALVDGRVVGVAFQGFSHLQNVGYIVPYPIIEHFLNDLVLHGRYTGFPSLGVKVSHMENDHLRQFKGLSALKASDLPPGVTPTGVLVVEVDNLRVSRYKAGKIRVPYTSRTLSGPRNLKMMQSVQAQEDVSLPSATSSGHGASFSGSLAPPVPDFVKEAAPPGQMLSAPLGGETSESAVVAAGGGEKPAARAFGQGGSEAGPSRSQPTFLQTQVTPKHILANRSQLLRLYALARRRQLTREAVADEAAADSGEERGLVETQGARTTAPPVMVRMVVRKLGPGIYSQIPEGDRSFRAREGSGFPKPWSAFRMLQRRLRNVQVTARGEKTGGEDETGDLSQDQEAEGNREEPEQVEGKVLVSPENVPGSIQKTGALPVNMRGPLLSKALPGSSSISSFPAQEALSEKASEAVEEGPRSEEELLLPNPYFHQQDAEENEIGFKVGDVILAIDGIDVADDGTVAFRQLERVSIDYTIMKRFNGETCKALVLRDGQVREVLLPITNLNLKVPAHTWDQKPKYFVFGGLVFTTLTRHLLEHMKLTEFPAEFFTKIKQTKYQEEEGDEVVVLSVILASELTVGYTAAPAIVTAVQGQKVRGLADVVRIVEQSTDNFLEFTVKISGISALPIVLDRKKAMAVNPKILGQHKILRDRSYFL
ncbi:trypsin domain-containing protein [Toxoplasma gondii FOU]|uniref:Trypsin domain-containing protein n=2 Tax=Toxoplasma gondii TaxID=5811 RepID=A0A086L7K4_TOXGO|nr:trypsin domain-containing protein [Toxoplasma gondii FOU]PUA89857.1 trypsin domain-containing protein [Toxoplasma gondii TgCATBr9]